MLRDAVGMSDASRDAHQVGGWTRKVPSEGHPCRMVAFSCELLDMARLCRLITRDGGVPWKIPGRFLGWFFLVYRNDQRSLSGGQFKTFQVALVGDKRLWRRLGLPVCGLGERSSSMYKQYVCT